LSDCPVLLPVAQACPIYLHMIVAWIIHGKD